MITASFLDELEKIADAYRRVAGTTNRLRKDIPMLRLRKSTPDKVKLRRISEAIEKSKGSVLGHPNVAVRADSLSLKGLGFKPTRLAVPLPGEDGILPISYRKGRLHGHQLGGLTLLHHDKTAPEGLAAVQHAITEGVPALAKRLHKQFQPPVQFRGD